MVLTVSATSIVLPVLFPLMAILALLLKPRTLLDVRSRARHPMMVSPHLTWFVLAPLITFIQPPENREHRLPVTAPYSCTAWPQWHILLSLEAQAIREPTLHLMWIALLLVPRMNPLEPTVLMHRSRASWGETLIVPGQMVPARLRLQAVVVSVLFVY